MALTSDFIRRAAKLKSNFKTYYRSRTGYLSRKNLSAAGFFRSCLKSKAVFVPQGQLRIARSFTAGDG
jgi:hypothetical protein